MSGVLKPLEKTIKFTPAKLNKEKQIMNLQQVEQKIQAWLTGAMIGKLTRNEKLAIARNIWITDYTNSDKLNLAKRTIYLLEVMYPGNDFVREEKEYLLQRAERKLGVWFVSPKIAYDDTTIRIWWGERW